MNFLALHGSLEGCMAYTTKRYELREKTAEYHDAMLNVKSNGHVAETKIVSGYVAPELITKPT